MDKYASFDLEIAKEIPEGCPDWKLVAPLGISCAALAFSDNPEVKYWYGIPQMTGFEVEKMVSDLLDYMEEYKIVTWNGCGFDFAVLADESDLYTSCSVLALDHIDLMLNITFVKGYMMGLDTTLKTMGLEGKKHNVALSDGTVLDNMSGSLAPQLWAKGETEAVLAYLHDDVDQPLKLIEKIIEKKYMAWTSKTGKYHSLFLDHPLTVRECFALPLPDTSWMTNPPTREQFVSWIPNWKERL